MKIPIEHGKYYHIYNRGNNFENLFINKSDYLHFLELYSIYINSIADTYAWCLLKNHFHILVRIKEEHEIGFLDSRNTDSEEHDVKWKTYFPENQMIYFEKKPRPNQMFKHFFNAYAKWFNNKYRRSGSLFQKNFERKWVNNGKYLTNLIVYIHNNPVKHGFASYAMDYPWSSYLTILADKPTRLKKQEVISYFNDIENYKLYHNEVAEKYENPIEHLILE